MFDNCIQNNNAWNFGQIETFDPWWQDWAMFYSMPLTSKPNLGVGSNLLALFLFIFGCVTRSDCMLINGYLYKKLPVLRQTACFVSAAWADTYKWLCRSSPYCKCNLSSPQASLVARCTTPMATHKVPRNSVIFHESADLMPHHLFHEG